MMRERADIGIAAAEPRARAEGDERRRANDGSLLRSMATVASGWVIWVRLAVGLIFLPEGIQKLAFPEILGAGRFAGIGIPWPNVMGPFVGWVEIICGSLILLGLFTRLAAVPLIITMIVAIISTKIPIWLGHDWLIFNLRELSRYGFWSFLHETRTDWAMLACSLYLLVVGGGRWSLDDVIYRRSKA